MKTILAIFLLFSAAFASAQTTITAPVSGTATITLPAAQTANVTYAAGVITINGVQVKSLTLTDLTLNGSGAPSFGTPIAFTVAAKAGIIPGGAYEQDVPVAGVVVGTHHVSVSPNVDPGVVWDWNGSNFVKSAGVVHIRIRNLSIQNQNLPAGSYTLKVF